jgi:hypothetical protein
VLDELPQALALVLIDDGDPPLLGLLDGGPVPDVVPALVALGQCVEVVVLVEVDALVVFCEVHEAVGVDVVDEQFVVEVDVVAVVLVGAVGVDFPHDLGVRLRTHLDGEGAVAAVCRLVQAAQEGVALHVPEHCLCAVDHVASLLEVQLVIEVLNLRLRLALKILAVGAASEGQYLLMLGLLISSSWISKLLGGMIW